MSANSVQAAPAGLAAKITPASLVAGRTLTGAYLLMLYLMNTKTKIAAGVVILLALMVGFTLQWEKSNKNSPTATDTASSRPPATSPSSPATKVAAMSPAQVSTPVVPAVAAHQSATTSATATSGPANADLKTDIPTLIHLLETDDFADIAEYVIPPDELPGEMRGMTREEFGNQLRQELANHGGTEMLLNALRSIQNDEPVMNDTGDQATFKLGAAAMDAQGAGHMELTFKKVNGLWYGPQ
jgi:hypothetical protein